MSEDVVEMLTTALEGSPEDPNLLRAARARILKLEAELWEATELPATKQSSPELSTLAAKMMDHEDPDVRSLAASVLSQDETEGQE